MIRQMMQNTILRQTVKLPVGPVVRSLRVAACITVLVLAPQTVFGESATYQVVSPIGESIVEMIAMAPRLDTLSGKTVCMTWNDGFKANVTLPIIGRLLEKKYPGIKIIPYTEMPLAHLAEKPGTPQTLSMALQAEFKKKGCDAVISGNGG